MPGVNSLANILHRIRSLLYRRFATKSARFHLAVSSGFTIVAVGFLVVAGGARYGVADSIWGIMNIPGLSEQPAATSERGPSPQYASTRVAHRRHARRGRADAFVQLRPSHHVHLASHAIDQPVQLARKSMCVRLCDGFAFPVGNYYGDGDRPAHEATCSSECPGAQTALFVLPAGSESIGDAARVSTGLNYSKMPVAFHYTNYVDETCSCHPQGGSRIKSLLRDFTLRRGDSVMTAKGLQVFHGGTGYPFKRKDFVALNQSRDIQRGSRATLKAIERASLATPATIASVKVDKPIVAAQLASTPGAEPKNTSVLKQAQN